MVVVGPADAVPVQEVKDRSGTWVVDDPGDLVVHQPVGGACDQEAAIREGWPQTRREPAIREWKGAGQTGIERQILVSPVTHTQSGVGSRTERSRWPSRIRHCSPSRIAGDLLPNFEMVPPRAVRDSEADEGLPGNPDGRGFRAKDPGNHLLGPGSPGNCRRNDSPSSGARCDESAEPGHSPRAVTGPVARRARHGGSAVAGDPISAAVVSASAQVRCHRASANP